MPRNVELDHDETMTPHVRSITLVRHGRTAYNAQHRLQGQIDIPLDEVGMWQVRQTASALRELYVDRHPEAACQLVVCSDLKRAAATAHAFADPLGLDVHPDVRVRERSFGDWEGIAVEELAKRFPEDYLFMGPVPRRRAQVWRRTEAERRQAWRRGVERLGVEGRLRYRPVRVLAWRLDLADVADAAGIERSAWRFRRHSVDAQRALGAAGAVRTAGRAAVASGTTYNHGPAIADTEQWEHPQL